MIRSFSIEKDNIISQNHFEAIGNVIAVIMHQIQNTDELLHHSWENFSLTGAINFIEREDVPLILFILSFILRVSMNYLLNLFLRLYQLIHN